jgi:hypothetical protein
MTLERPAMVRDNIEYTRQNVEWQIKRIYRARNAIVHRGAASGLLPQLTQHLHCYLVKAIMCILADLDRLPQWRIRDSLEHRVRLFDHVVSLFGKTEGHKIALASVMDPEKCMALQTEPFAWPAPAPSQPEQSAATKTAPSKIAILGWGSLLWEENAAFDAQHEKWDEQGGPTLKIEFSRISEESRKGALTLVIDEVNGEPIAVSWCLSRRPTAEEAMKDLRIREKTKAAEIGCVRIGEGSPKAKEGSEEAIAEWGRRQGVDAVIWTALESNFAEKKNVPFKPNVALKYLETLRGQAKSKAVEYLERARAFVKTPLRSVVEQSDWFKEAVRRE